jgi:RNA polymerase sigma-70 factor, ECF subfamily
MVNVRRRVEAEASNLAELLVPHLDSAHNLARWLMRNSADAEDVVQEAYARAFRYASGFRGGDPRAWLLAIVRNTCYRSLRKRCAAGLVEPFDEDAYSHEACTSNPEQQLMRRADGELVETALAALPARFREILVLREVEGLSYSEMSDVLGVPIGTVMSTLSRARDRLRHTAERILDARVTSSGEATM